MTRNAISNDIDEKNIDLFTYTMMNVIKIFKLLYQN